MKKNEREALQRAREESKRLRALLDASEDQCKSSATALADAVKNQSSAEEMVESFKRRADELSKNSFNIQTRADRNATIAIETAKMTNVLQLRQRGVVESLIQERCELVGRLLRIDQRLAVLDCANEHPLYESNQIGLEPLPDVVRAVAEAVA